MNTQCGTCGSFGAVGGIVACQHCGAPLCAKCKSGHESVCRELSKQRSMGLGRTVVPLGVRQSRPEPATPENPPVYPAVVNTSIQPADPFVAAGVEEKPETPAETVEQFLEHHPELKATVEEALTSGQHISAQVGAQLAAIAPEGSDLKNLIDPLGLVTADAEGHPVATGVEPPAPAPTSPEPVVENSNTLNDGHTTTV